MDGKKRVCVLFGGRSAEHDVSIQSAVNVINSLDRDVYDVLPVQISRSGEWKPGRLLTSDHPFALSNDEGSNLAIPTEASGTHLSREVIHQLNDIDVFFPVLHGPYGEDGSVQGLMKLINAPFVGCTVLGSALTLDKDVTKRLLRDAGIPVCRWVTIFRADLSGFNAQKVVEELGLPLFVKPANLGSSVGTTRVAQVDQLMEAVREALRYDHKVLIEEAVLGREIECGVIGNDRPRASVVGEVITSHAFYSYEAKYIDEHGAALEIPARVSEHVASRTQEMAVRAFTILGCAGLSRVDFFLQEDDTLLVNELNSLPGFTNRSMFPKLWEATGMSQGHLLDELIRLAIERFECDQRLASEYRARGSSGREQAA